MEKLTYFDSASTNETLNPRFSQWVQEVKDDKTKARSTACKKTFSLSNMGFTALKSHKKSEKHKKNAASVNDIQIKRTNIFVSNSKFESTSVSPVFKQDDTSSVSPALNDSNSTAKYDVKNNVQSSSSSIFFMGENITKTKILWTLHVSYKHYSYNSCSEIGQLFQKMFPDSSICQKFIFGKTKASYNITHGLAPYFHDLVYNSALQSDHIVACSDESQNEVVQKGQMDLCVRYWDVNKSLAATRYFDSSFWDMPLLNDLQSSFTSLLNDLILSKIFQVSMDGRDKLILKFLDQLIDQLEIQSEKSLLDMGSCSLHVVHGAF